MTGSRGLKVNSIDGGSINDVTTDVAAGTTITNDVETMLQTLVARGNRCHLSTMIRRELETYTAAQLIQTEIANNGIRRMATKYQTPDGLVTLSDVAEQIAHHDTMFTAGDAVHFNLAGDKLYGQKFQTIITTPALPVPGSNEELADLIADAVAAHTTITGIKTETDKITAVKTQTDLLQTVYWAQIAFAKGGSADEYKIVLMQNDAAVTATAGTGRLTVYDKAGTVKLNNVTLIASTAPDAALYYTDSTKACARNATYDCVVTATISGTSRNFPGVFSA
jgi:hypothetical protein